MTTIDPGRVLLLALSCTQESLGGYATGDSLIEKAGRVMEASRKVGVPVVHGVVQFRLGYPEVGPDSGFNSLKAVGRSIAGNPAADPHPDLFSEGDLLLVKRRASAFTGTDLDVLIRAMGRPHLVLLGVRTSGAILRTYSHATDADYEVTVISDCCLDPDEELHQTILSKLLGRGITTADEFVRSLGEQR